MKNISKILIINLILTLAILLFLGTFLALEFNKNSTDFSSINDNLKLKILNGNALYEERTSELVINEISDLIINDKEFLGITDAKLKFDKDGKIIYAKFVSINGGFYSFEYNGKTFKLNVKENSQVLFNPEEKTISASNIKNINFDGKEVRFADSVKLNIDYNGNVISAEITKGSYVSERNELFNSKKPTFNVFFNEMSKDLSGDAILFNENKITLKGTILSSDLLGSNGRYSFEGRNDDSFVEFNKENSNFKIIRGDSKFGNYEHEILIENGEANIRLLDKRAIGESFSFDIYNSGGIIEKGFINEINNEYKITFSSENGENIVASVPLGTIRSKFNKNENIISNSYESKVNFLTNEITVLNKALGTANEEQKLTIELEILKKQNQLSYIKGEDISESIKRTNEFILSLNNPDIKAKADVALAELKTQQSLDGEYPKLFSITNQKMVSSFGGYMMPAARDVPQTLSFETMSNGEINAYYFEGKRYNLNEDIPAGLASENVLAIKNLQENGATLENLRTSEYSRELRYEGYNKDSELFKENFAYAKEARSILENSLEYAVSNNDKNLESEIRTKIAQTYYAEKNPSVAILQFRGIANSDASNEIKSKALLAVVSISESEGEILSPNEVLSLAKDIVRLNPDDWEAQYALTQLNNKYLERYSSLSSKEIAMTNSELDRMLGSGNGAWQTTKDVLSIIFNPVTNAYTISNEKFILDTQKENYDLAILRRVAVNELMRLNDNGINLQNFAQSSPIERFKAVYESNSYDRTLSFDELTSYLDRSGYDKSAKDLSSVDFEKLRQIIQAEKGEGVSRELDNNLLVSINKLKSIDDGIKNDPTLYSITTNSKTSYEGTTSLDKAFKQDRLGNSIDFSTKEKLALATSDVLLNPLSYIGITSAVKAGQVSKFVAGIAESTATNVAITGATEYNPGLGTSLAILAIGRGLSSLANIEGKLKPDLLTIKINGEEQVFLKGSEESVEILAKGIDAVIDKSKGTIITSEGQIISYGTQIPRSAEVLSKEKNVDILMQNAARSLGKENEMLETQAKAIDDLVNEAKVKFLEKNDISGREMAEEAQKLSISTRFYKTPQIPKTDYMEPISNTPRFNEDIVESIETIKVEKTSGAREGAEYVNVHLKDNTEIQAYKKKYNLDDLIEEIKGEGVLSPQDAANLDRRTVKEDIFEQIRRVKDKKPEWAPIAYRELDDNNLEVFMNSYVGKEWSKMEDVIYSSKFYERIKYSDKKVVDDILRQLEELKATDGGIPILSDSHSGNVLIKPTIGIKNVGNKNVEVFTSIEIQPIDYFDPLKRFDNDYRVRKLQWISNLEDHIRNPENIISHLKQIELRKK